jgi:hypothetical protein
VVNIPKLFIQSGENSSGLGRVHSKFNGAKRVRLSSWIHGFLLACVPAVLKCWVQGEFIIWPNFIQAPLRGNLGRENSEFFSRWSLKKFCQPQKVDLKVFPVTQSVRGCETALPTLHLA